MPAEERAALVAAMGDLHRSLMLAASRVAVLGEDYKAIASLSQSIIATIQSLTGDDPEWMQMPAIRYGGDQKDRL